MPAVLGAMKVVNVSSGGELQIGDTGFITPKTSTKLYSGAGSSNTGDAIRNFNLLSSTNTNDLDAVDGNVIGAV